eukprot:3716541-Rhodomonas_salina.2
MLPFMEAMLPFMEAMLPFMGAMLTITGLSAANSKNSDSPASRCYAVRGTETVYGAARSGTFAGSANWSGTLIQPTDTGRCTRNAVNSALRTSSSTSVLLPRASRYPATGSAYYRYGATIGCYRNTLTPTAYDRSSTAYKRYLICLLTLGLCATIGCCGLPASSQYGATIGLYCLPTNAPVRCYHTGCHCKTPLVAHPSLLSP